MIEIELILQNKENNNLYFFNDSLSTVYSFYEDRDIWIGTTIDCDIILTSITDIKVLKIFSEKERRLLDTNGQQILINNVFLRGIIEIREHDHILIGDILLKIAYMKNKREIDFRAKYKKLIQEEPIYENIIKLLQNELIIIEDKLSSTTIL